MLRIGIGSLSAIIGIVVLASPRAGFIILLLMVSVALLLTGIELVVVGSTGRRIRTPL
jgi:uncharacterized membrane protein HdeD (DUF308 family)